MLFNLSHSAIKRPEPIGNPAGLWSINDRGGVRSGLWSLSLVGLLVGLPVLNLAAVILPGVAPASAQAAPAIVKQGYSQLSEGLVNQAISSFLQAIERYPDSLEAKLGLAIAYRKAGKDADAWTAYQTVLAQDPQNQLALRAVGTLGGYKPEWQVKGIDALTTLLTQVPTDREARAQRALLYGYQGRFPESLGDYEIALQAGNPTPEVLLGAAQIYTYGGNSPKALELFRQYRTVTGKAIGSNAAIAYARALRETGNAPEAIRLLEEQLPKPLTAYAIQIRAELSQAYLANRQSAQALAVLDPLRGRSDSQLALARALNELGRQDGRPQLQAEAASLYQQALSQTPNPSNTLVREVADVLSGIPQERPTALNLYRQLVTQNPTDRTLVIQALALESQLGTLSKAEVQQRLRSVLLPLPQDPAQQFAIARALVRLEPDPEFLPIYQALIQAGVNEPFLNFRMAQLLIERDDLAGAQAAIAAYRNTPAGARDLAPELLLAEIDRRSGNFDGAAQRYQALVGTGSLDSDVVMSALRGLAGVRLAQNRPLEALAVYDQLLQRDPNDWQIRLGRAAIAYQARQITEDDADAILGQFLQTRPAATPQEFYSLVSLLPASARREPLYNALLQVDPNNMDIQVRLIQLLAARNPQQAQARANALLNRMQRQVSDNPQTMAKTLFLRGQLAQALGNLQQAGDAYQAILALQPENLEAVSALGGVRFQQRRFDSAERLYTRVLAYQPENSGAQQSLADLSNAQGKPLEALERFEALKMKQGTGNLSGSGRRVLEIQEGFLQQRGFQPPWERY
jgi:cellulose synthase operon protein C